MNLLEIKETPLVRQKHFRVGRGGSSGAGRTAGRGMRGQNCRSAGKGRGPMEGGTMALYRRIPKRGFNNARFQDHWAVVNLAELNKLQPGTEVTLELLQKEQILKVKFSKKTCWKLLGQGTLKVENLTVKVHSISKQAREKLEQAKGKVEIIPVRRKPIKWRKKERAAAQIPRADQTV